jgi:hypothetical protein
VAGYESRWGVVARKVAISVAIFGVGVAGRVRVAVAKSPPAIFGIVALLWGKLLSSASRRALAGRPLDHYTTGKPEALVRIVEKDGEYTGNIVRQLDPTDDPDSKCERYTD